MIRNMSRRFVESFKAMLAAARTERENKIDVEYLAGKMAKLLNKQRRRRAYFDYSSINTHGCPWPGRAAARARHRAGSGRRPK